MIDWSKKIITTLLLTSFAISPYFLYALPAKAQTNPSGYQSNSTTGYGTQMFGAEGSGLVGYISGIAPAIAQLPLCKEKLGSAIKNLFSKDSPAAASIPVGYAGMAYAAAKYQQSLGDAAEVSKIIASSVPTYDETLHKEVDVIGGKVENIDKNTESLEENDTCLKSIARMVIKMLLQKITMSTVAWIQSGFEGKPFFIENIGVFMTDIARTEILQFGLEINDPNIFPFGRDYMIRQASYFNRRFQENARYSLNEMIAETSPGYNANDFIGDFSKGGWNGWISMTQVPANNPLGFQLIASEELSTRVNGQVTDINTRLAQADGFLGDQRCVEPKGLTREAHNAALEHPVQIPIVDPATGKTVGYDTEGTCKRWEYVTPGKLVAEAATTAVNYPTDNLLKAEDMNDAVASIMDALLARFSSDLMNQGFANLSSQGSDGYLIIDQDNFYNNYNSTQVENDFNRTNIRGWLASNPHFNIRRDLTQALIDEQRIFIEKATEQNLVLDDLIKTIRQLDYCIPGPHPGWKQDSVRILAATKNAIVSKTPADMKNYDAELITGLLKEVAFAAGAAIGATIGSVVPGLGTAIGAAIGALVGFAIDLLGGPSEERKVELYYSGIVNMFTGLHMNKKNTPKTHIRNKHEVTNAFDTILNRYEDLIDKYFTPGFLPTVAEEAKIKFLQIPGYEEVQQTNRERIVALESTVKRLSDLKIKIDTLNSAGLTEDAYEAQMLPIITEFSRLSEDMVSGDDISFVDNATKQSRSEVTYIIDDLITGPSGCEQDLQYNRQPTFVPDPSVYPPISPPADPSKTWIVRNTLRAEYPFPLWYDYNYNSNGSIRGPGTPLPIPDQIPRLTEYTNKTTSNLMPNYNSPESVPSGPGFLSRAYFDNSENKCEDPTALAGFILDCLVAHDLFNHINSWAVSVGKNTFDPYPDNQQTLNSFEQAIYVY